jgi:hypothetical protein
MSVSSQFFNSLRDTFLPEKDAAQLKETAKHLGTAKKALIASSVALGCLAIYWHSPVLLVPAYISVETAMISSNVQEIYNDVGTTLSVAYSNSICEKQLFQNAPVFRLVNWVVNPYIHTEERVRKLILNRIFDGIQSAKSSPPEKGKSDSKTTKKP